MDVGETQCNRPRCSVNAAGRREEHKQRSVNGRAAAFPRSRAGQSRLRCASIGSAGRHGAERSILEPQRVFQAPGRGLPTRERRELGGDPLARRRTRFGLSSNVSRIGASAASSERRVAKDDRARAAISQPAATPAAMQLASTLTRAVAGPSRPAVLLATVRPRARGLSSAQPRPNCAAEVVRACATRRGSGAADAGLTDALRASLWLSACWR